VFRWGAADAAVELRVVSAARCARIEAEVRTEGATGVSRWSVGGAAIGALAVGPTWTSIATASFDVLDGQTIEMHTSLSGPPPDALHALAVRSPSIVPTTCDAGLVRVGRPTLAGEAAVPEPLVDALEYGFDPPAGAHCIAVHARIEDAPPGRIGVRTPTTTAWVVVSTNAVSIDPPPFDAHAGHALTVLRAPLDPASPPSRLVALTVEPTTCP
jgi:hypothetical protein